MQAKTLIVARTFSDGSKPLILGSAVLSSKGWKFYPRTTAHKPSRKHHAKLESALPRWVDYPRSTESWWKDQPVQITNLRNEGWNMQATVYQHRDAAGDSTYQVVIRPLVPTGHEQLNDPPPFVTLKEATDHAKIVLGLKG